MKRVFIIHGWGGTTQSNWIPWLSSQLANKGFQVYVLEMPDTDNPKMDQWVSTLAKEVGKPDTNTYLVGHSMGCQTILRYLESLKSGKNVGGVLLVAGFLTIKDEMMVGEGGDVLRPWVEKKIDLDKVKAHCAKITAIQSTNDPYIPIEDAKVFEKQLGARVQIIPNAGHFTIARGGYSELHIALNELLKMAT